MAQAGPMRVTPVVDLTTLGVTAANLTFTNVTMESEKYICVRETDTGKVCIVDLAQPNTPIRRPITADSAIMNPEQKIIALRAAQGNQDQLQIFNLDTKAKVCQHAMPQKVVYWKWVTKNKIGIVTDTSVFHWEMAENSTPVKVFDRTANLNGAQIISYRISADEKWCVLIGIAPGTAERPSLVKGAMQLFSVEQNRSQALEAHGAAFAQLQIGGAETNLIAFAQKTPALSKLHVIELGAPQAGRQVIKRQAELFFPQEFADDFPVNLQISTKLGLVYVVTKVGLLFVYDLETATAIYRNRISQDPVFLACQSETTGGFYAINRRGQVLFGEVNPQTMVPFVSQQLNKLDLALALAKRGNLPGAEQLVVQQFETMMQGGQFKEAAELAADSPQGVLRTTQVIQRLKASQPQPGQKPPLLVYFGSLLMKGSLNAEESLELAQLVIGQNKKDLLLAWWNDNKLTPSEPLGDLIHGAAQGDSRFIDIAVQIFQRSGANQKVVMCHAEKGDIDNMLRAAGAQPGSQPDYMYLLQSLMMTNPQGAVALAKRVAKEPGPPIDINVMTDLFLQRNMVPEATAFLLDVLQDDKPEHAMLQTKLLEVNLVTNPKAADTIMANYTLSHYDKPRIAQLCEKAGLYMRALQHYTDLPDIKRCIVNTHVMDRQAVIDYFGSLSAEWAIECMREILQTGLPQNVQLVVDIAKEYTEQLSAARIIELFESFNNYQALFLYLGSRIATSQDPEEHYKYIESAARIQQLREVERATRESNFYPPERVKNFLMDAKLPDARPLINVCDRHNMVHDLTTYLYTNNMLRYIEGYVQKVNPNSAPEVVGALLDCQAPDDFINNLILSVRSLIPVEKLVDEVEKRNRLKLLTPFLEHLISEGSTDEHVHNALGKIIIETNNNPEHFLKNNEFYNPLVVGKYCERRDPHLACIAYKRGQCDDALVDCTNRHSLFKLQARYVVGRQDPELWSKVLAEENTYRRQLIDQVVSTALPESSEPDKVSTTVKAFMEMGLQAELIELLEKIVLQNSAFSNNKNLQNLLIITAIKSDTSRVMDYIHRLDNFDGLAVGEIALTNNLFNETFEIYRKFGHKVLAVKVLIDNVMDLQRAVEFASKVDEPAVWSELGHAQLLQNQVPDAIMAYLRAADSSKYKEVITQANQYGCFDDLVKYLLMARKKVKDSLVDTELVVGFARTNQLGAMEEFIHATHQANLQACGDRCFEQGLYEAAKILFTHIPNWGRLASTLVRLHHFQEAVDAARKANSPQTWKEVCYACVDEGQFRLAQLCGLNIIINADDLEEVSEYYQKRGHFQELMELMEAGIGLERAHMGIFTELGILYAKYAPTRLMEHLKLFSNRINIPRLIRVCEDQQLWKELTFLYVAYDEYDNAANVMMQHPEAWEHAKFKDVCVKVSNVEVFYKAIGFYLECHPDLLNDLLKVIEGRVDHARVVDIMRRAHHLALVKDYLLVVQKHNLAPVNDAVNELLIEEEDFEALRTSITTYDNFDQLALALVLESHELIEFRRIAAFIYKKQFKWRKAVELAQRDRLFKDAMETAAQSADADLVEELLRWFMGEGEKECFAACLYTCYDHIRPDVVLELAWMHGVVEYVMPYLVQFVKEYTNKVDLLMSERKESKEKKQEAASAQAEQEAMRNAMLQMPLALPAAPSSAEHPGGYPAGYDASGYGAPPAGAYGMQPPGYGAPGYPGY